MPDGTDHEAIVEAFLHDANVSTNPRSITAVRSAPGGALHLKHATVSLEEEAESLRAARALTVSGVRAVELVDYDAGRNVILTRHVVGPTLFNHVWNRTLAVRRWFERGPEPRDLLVRLGQWAAAYHSLTATRTSEARLACLHHVQWECERKVNSLIRSGLPLLPAGAPTRVERFAREALESADWDDLQTCRIHGDFSLVNMLVDDAGMVHICDFTDGRQGFALEDIARLWCAVWEISRCGGHRTRTLTPVLDEILRCNGMSLQDVDAPPFRLLRVWNGLTRLNERAVIWDRLDRGARSLHRRLMEHHVAFLRHAGLLD